MIKRQPLTAHCVGNRAVVTYFEQQARLQRISADQTVETVFADIEKVFSPLAPRKSRARRLVSAR